MLMNDGRANPLAGDLEHILTHTRELWEELRGERLFITGGTGFFGHWLLESFAWANERLDLKASALMLTRAVKDFEDFREKSPHLADHPAIQYHVGDVRTFTFPHGKFSQVIHLAAKTNAWWNTEQPFELLETIVQGTRHALDFAVSCGAQRFLLASSGAVYGRQPAELLHIPEDYCGAPSTLIPASTYGEGKRMAELLCVLYQKSHGINVKIARCFSFVGPYLDLDFGFAIGNFIRDGLRGGPIEIRGDGASCRSYLYAADLAIWLWTILFRGEVCRPYNVGSETPFKIADVARIVRGYFGPHVNVRIANAPDGRSAGRYVPSVHRARTELGLEQMVGLEESIRRTVGSLLPGS